MIGTLFERSYVPLDKCLPVTHLAVASETDISAYQTKG